MRAASIFAFAALAALALAACQKEADKKGDSLKVEPPAPAGVTQPPVPTTPPPPAVAPAPATEAPVAVPPPPPAPPTPAAAPKPPAPSAFDGGFDLAGTEPFWNLQIRSGGLKLTRPDHADLTAANPGFTELGKSALWTATVDKSRMTVTVTKAPCSDGMSDRTYAYAAKVQLWGATLSGCATKARG